MKTGYVELTLYLGCFNFLLNLYSTVVVFYGILSHFILLVLLSGSLFIILLRFRIPKPKASVVRNYFGADWGSYMSIGQPKSGADTSFTLKVIAHRACGLDSPENSLSALRAVYKEGIKAVEFDVILTADGVPIIFHDFNLSRMSCMSYNVSQVTFDEIKEIDISVKHPLGKNFPGEKIPTLDEYINFCLEKEIRMIIDLKSTGERIVKIITDVYEQYPEMYELSMISSFNATTIYKIRAKDPKIICSLAWRPFFYSHEEYNFVQGPLRPRTLNFFIQLFFKCINILHEWALWKFGYYILGLSAILLHKDMITRNMINYWHKRGIRVIAWNVNLPTEKQYYEKILEITYLTDTVINS